MIILVCILIGIIAAVVIGVYEWGLDWDLILNGIMGALIGLVLSLVIMLCVCGFGNPKMDIVEMETCEIYALVDNARYEGRVSGSVFLVQSRINEKLKYSYMYFEDSKGYGFGEVPAADCYLNYNTDPNTPSTITRLHYDYANPVVNFLFGGMFCYDEYVFYIPADAEVIDDFVIDFE